MALSNRTKFSIVLATPLVVFGVLELSLIAGGFRYESQPPALIVWNPRLDEELVAGTGLHAMDDICLWSPRAGAEVMPGEVINVERLRGPLVQRERAPEVGRVLLLGESSMFGMQVPFDETIAGRLPALMFDRGFEIEVINAAVIGHSVWQGIARYKAELRDLRPDVCVASFGTINEHFYAKDLPDREKLETLTYTSTPFGNAVALLRENLRSVQWLARLADQGQQGRARAEQLEATIRQSRRGLRVTRDEVGQRDFPGQRRVALESFRQGLEELERCLAADGVQLVLITMARKPPMEERSPVLEDYSAALVSFAQDLRIPLVPFRGWLLEHAPTAQRAGPFFLPDQRLHPSSLGHEKIAEMIAPMLDDPLRLRLDAR